MPLAARLRRKRATEHELRRCAVQRGSEAERIDRDAVFERDGGLCGICEAPVDPADWHLDHRRPLARGGAHTYDNVQVAHPMCNYRKGARSTG